MRSLVSSLLALATAASALAQSATSRPVGYLVQTIPAGQSRSFSVPFDADTSSLPGAIGRLTAVGANYLENSAAAWTAGAFSTAAAPYFVRLTSGAHAGRVFRVVAPANTATRLYVDADGLDLPGLDLAVGAAGATFEILPGDTLASFFGATTPANTLVLHGAADPATADLVQVWGGAAWLNFYYNTTWARWARDTDVQADPSRDNFLLRPDRGLMLTRRSTTPLELAVLGRVLNTPQRAVHARTENSLTFLATMQTVDVTLGALALQSSTRTAAWRGAANAADADLLYVWGGATWFVFYHNTTAAQWHRVGENPAVNRDTYLLKAGTPVFVQRRTPGTTAADKTVAFPAPGK
jgi:uncharacterized protein (TIGR02597 family)